MKKVMVGILILIPVIILLIVIAVSNFLQMAAWIAVDDIAILDKSGAEAESVTVIFPSDKPVYNMYDYLDIKVMPDYANRYSIEWRISGNVECMDKEYEKKYNDYLSRREAHDKYLSDLGAINEQIRITNSEIDSAKRALDRRIEEIKADDSLINSEKNQLIAEETDKYETLKADREAKITALNAQKNSLVEPELGVEVEPAAMFVDDNNKEVTSNTSGKFVINSYCRFNIIIQVESVNKTLSVIAEGYNVESIELANIGEDDSTLKVGEKMMLEPNYHPMSSIVTETEWKSSDPSVASVDQNGVVTAHKIGSAQITMKANKYDVDETVTSSAYTVTVEAGASKFGSQFSTSKTQFTLEEVGISAADIVSTQADGYEIGGINNNIVTLTADVAHIETKYGTVTVNKCGANDIVIENAELYKAESGYVFAVGGLTLKLKAVWADALKEDSLDGVVWTAKSDGNIASVTATGEITATESGLVIITAEKDGNKATLILNLQIKLVSMKLRTGNDYFKVGLALETVFAAEKYQNVTINNDKEPNSTLIQIIGAPKRTQDDTDDTYKAKLSVFYNAFTYEIVAGEDYAYFDANEPNRLIFKPNALEGKGKQTVKVLVRAKYPRYASAQNLIKEEVDIKVIYGVEAGDIKELRQASDDQKAYAYADGNLQSRELVFEHTVTEDHAPEKYRIYNAEYSLRTYGISVVNNIWFDKNPDGTLLEIHDYNNIRVYGDLYGNGNWLLAERNQVYNVDAMLWIKWSNVTVSNFNLRANKIDKDGTLSADETKGLTGEGFEIFADSHERNRLTNVRYEFSIIENGRRAGQAYNADYVLDGLVMRNFDSTAFYVPARMCAYEEGGEYITYPDYCHVTMNNCVYSNCLATIGSYAFEAYTITSPDSRNPLPGSKQGEGRFVHGDLEKNEQYFQKYFASKGITTQLRQTGFIDIYNWQNIKNASLIDLGDNAPAAISDLLGAVSSELFAANPEFAKCKFVDEAENISYLHMGFLFSGINFDAGIFDEPVHIDATFEDTRFAEHIYTKNVKKTTGGLVGAAETLVSTLSIEFVGYTGDTTKNDLTPYSTFEINESFIRRLHQTA